MTSTPPSDYDKIYSEVLRDAIKKQVRMIIAGIIGFSVFCVCLGLLGIIAIIKSIFQ